MQREPSWPAMCRRFDITGEQEQAFTRGLALSRADAGYFAETHEAKRVRRDERYDVKLALEQALAVFDAALTARLADRAGRDLDVAGAAHRLGRQRLAVADRVAARTSEFENMVMLTSDDWQHLQRAYTAIDGMHDYLRGALNRYRFEYLTATNQHDVLAQLYGVEGLPVFPDTPPRYTGLTMGALHRHKMAHKHLIAGTARWD